MTASELTTLNFLALALYILLSDRLSQKWRKAWLLGVCSIGIAAVTVGFHG